VWDKGLSLVGVKPGNTLLIMTLITQFSEKTILYLTKIMVYSETIFNVYVCHLLCFCLPVGGKHYHNKFREVTVKSFLLF
jgi:hypothetical protein